MRTTIIIPDEIFQKASEETGITQKTELVKMGLEALIRQKSAERLAELYGSNKKASAPIRNRMH